LCTNKCEFNKRQLLLLSLREECTIDQRQFFHAFIGSVSATADYDPWGLQLNGRSVNADANPKYKFIGKERDVESGYDYFGARYYDSRIGIWRSVDPLHDKYPNQSPYSYTGNNPIVRVDADGRAWNLVAGGVGAGVGAIVGFAANVISQRQSGASWNQIDWSQAGAHAAGGAVGGLVAGLTMGASLAATGTGMAIAEGAAGGALASAAGGIVTNTFNGQEVNARTIAADAAAGALGGAVAAPVGNMVKDLVKETIKTNVAIAASPSMTAKQVAGAMGGTIVANASTIIGVQTTVSTASAATVQSALPSSTQQGVTGQPARGNGGNNSIAPPVSTRTTAQPVRRQVELREQN
jgi:RHS repeat-associated protein